MAPFAKRFRNSVHQRVRQIYRGSNDYEKRPGHGEAAWNREDGLLSTWRCRVLQYHHDYSHDYRLTNPIFRWQGGLPVVVTAEREWMRGSLEKSPSWLKITDECDWDGRWQWTGSDVKAIGISIAHSVFMLLKLFCGRPLPHLPFYTPEHFLIKKCRENSNSDNMRKTNAQKQMLAHFSITLTPRLIKLLSLYAMEEPQTTCLKWASTSQQHVRRQEK